MSDIGVGDFVEFIGPLTRGDKHTSARGWRISGDYYVGFVSVVEAVKREIRLLDGSVVPGIRVRGIKVHRPDGSEGWYPLYQWRRVYRPQADFIESLNQPSPELEEA